MAKLKLSEEENYHEVRSQKNSEAKESTEYVSTRYKNGTLNATQCMQHSYPIHVSARWTSLNS
eukprot:scaffold141369_cov51-Prasinocladus_malaysianus.AAC.2